MSNTLKNRLLIAGFIVVLFMCYKFAFAKTFELKAEHDTLIKEQQIFNNTPKQLALLKKRSSITIHYLP
ncbi:hypothetical protein KAOT1_00055, partial [Kordia algicida OT-1]